MDGFPQHFRACVGPGLRQAARYQGLLVACGDTSYSDAVAEVWGRAWRLGASRLPHRLATDLRDRIGDWVAEAIEAALPMWEDAEAAAERAAIDVARYFRGRAVMQRPGFEPWP